MFKAWSRTVVLEVWSCISTCASEFLRELIKCKLLSPSPELLIHRVCVGVQMFALLIRSQVIPRPLVQDLCNCHCNKNYYEVSSNFRSIHSEISQTLIAFSRYLLKIKYFFKCLLLEQKNTIDFCMMVFRPATLLNFKVVKPRLSSYFCPIASIARCWSNTYRTLRKRFGPLGQIVTQI